MAGPAPEGTQIEIPVEMAVEDDEVVAPPTIAQFATGRNAMTAVIMPPGGGVSCKQCPEETAPAGPMPGFEGCAEPGEGGSCGAGASCPDLDGGGGSYGGGGSMPPM
jgi:uncharacterized membrane protein YgcG